MEPTTSTRRRERSKSTVERALTDFKLCIFFIIEVLWRIAELHFFRLILFVFMVIATSHFCAAHMVVIVFVILTLLLPSINLFMTTLTGVYLFAFFIFRTVVFSKEIKFMKDESCNESDFGFSETESFNKWIGLPEDENSLYLPDLPWLITALLLITLQWVVYIRQKRRRAQLQLDEPPPGIIFVDAIEGKLFDEDLFMAFKVLLNYCFYKFGLEFSLIALVFVASRRMDMLATVLLSWVFVISMFHQYPWSLLIDDISKNENLLVFLDLADYKWKSKRSDFNGLLWADFLALMFVAAQLSVFRTENKHHPAGHNSSIYRNGDYTLRRKNPYYDFIGTQRSFVDYIKITVFQYGHWITLITVLVAGLGGTSLFALGYLVLAFWMLWEGNNLYTMRNYRVTLSRWYIVCAYNVLAMLWKVSLQIVGCVFAKDLDDYDEVSNAGISSGCIIRQLFSIVCVNKKSQNRLFPDESKCAVERSETEIGFDLVAFIFIIFQLRILHSYLFQHCIINVRCEIIQASRGAILINQLVEKQMLSENEEQKKKFKEIKERMDSIRKQHSQTNIEPETYAQAKRAGDYYMFTEPNEENIDDPANLLLQEQTHDTTSGPSNTTENSGRTKAAGSPNVFVNSEIPEKKNDTQEKIKDSNQKQEQTSTKSLSSVSSTASSSRKPNDENSIDKQERIDELTHENDQRKRPRRAKCYTASYFVLKCLKRALHYTSSFFNHHSREHRYVEYVLDQEKIRMKRDMSHILYNTEERTNDLRYEWRAGGMQMIGTLEEIDKAEEGAQAKWEQRHSFGRFIISVASLIAAYTHVLCYICACIAHAYCGGLITLPLPLMVFFWGTLSSPRPSKVFWVTMITYTELVIVIKFIFQFSFLHPKKVAFGIEWLPFAFGVQRVDYFATRDVILLISLFLHRYMLRRIGLWKDANIADTFAIPEAVEEKRSTGGEEQQNEPNDSLNAVESGRHSNVSTSNTRRTGFSLFYNNLRYPRFRYIRDLYPIMFFLDLFCILILVVKYSHFGEMASNSNVLLSSRIPLMFVVVLFILTVMLVIDRALYLRKAVFWKLIYQLVIVVCLHVWIFIGLVVTTETPAAQNSPAGFFYVVKCMYLIVSAWQIRNGYPQRCTGNLLCQAYGLSNYILYNVYLLAPLVFELRTIIEWAFTDTTMPIFDFIKMEVYYSKIFLVKCSRVLEEKWPAPHGESKSKLVKYGIGVPAVLGILILLFSPLLAYAVINHIGPQNHPERVDITVGLQGFPPFYSMSARGFSIKTLNKKEINELDSWFRKQPENENIDRNKIRRALPFIKDYYNPSGSSDIMEIKFRPESQVLWPISSESVDAMLEELTKNSTINNMLKFEVHVKFVRERKSNDEEPLVHTADWTTEIYSNSTLSLSLQNAIETPGSHFVIEKVLPYYLVVPSEGKVVDADVLLQALIQEGTKIRETFSTVDLVLETNSWKQKRWTMQSNVSSYLKGHCFSDERIDYGPYTDQLREIHMVAFVDRLFPAIITKWAQGGIAAMYIAVVYFGARLIRAIITSETLSVIIDEMPNPNRVLQLCLDIYLAREEHDFRLEEDLYAKLIFLFRSPETLIKWTRENKQ
ncbi:Piezo-type mechanosensitive ion channel component 2 [Aphelenchoides besseyi]|nr:Piezo-type mechanosensitive ion channel component 2 [Aphelenchoides besseyi]KAI6208655.1 Piezo-type mechanosensitive ion channel component 2 [Aphelenchoides besseyi]